MARAHYPHSFKLKVVSDVILNEDKKGIQSKIANKYGISIFSVSNWVKKYGNEVKLTNDKANNESELAETAPNTSKQENEILKSIITQKELEIKYLKNQFEEQLKDGVCLG